MHTCTCIRVYMQTRTWTHAHLETRVQSHTHTHARRAHTQVIDYSAHVVHNFTQQDASLSRDARVRATIEEMGPSVLLGVTSTFWGIVPLAFANSEVFRYATHAHWRARARATTTRTHARTHTHTHTCARTHTRIRTVAQTMGDCTDGPL